MDNQNIIHSGLYKYDRVYETGMFFFEISIFLLIERGISRMEKLKVMLHFATTEMCLFVFLYLFEFSALIVLIQNSKR